MPKHRLDTTPLTGDRVGLATVPDSGQRNVFGPAVKAVWPQAGYNQANQTAVDWVAPTDPEVVHAEDTHFSTWICSLYIDEDRVYALTENDIGAFDKRDMNYDWSWGMASNRTNEGAVDIDAGLLYKYGAGQWNAFDLESGNREYTDSGPNEPRGRVTLDENRNLYYPDTNSNYVKVDAETFTTVWQTGVVETGGADGVCVVPDDDENGDICAAGSGDRDFYIFDKADGTILHSYDESGNGEMNDTSYYDGYFYLTADEDNSGNSVLYKFDPSANVVWEVADGYEDRYGPPVKYGDVITAADSTFAGTVFGANDSDGSIEWTISGSSSDYIWNAPVDRNGNLIYATGGREITSIDVATGDVNWQMKIENVQGGSVRHLAFDRETIWCLTDYDSTNDVSPHVYKLQ